MHNDIGTFTLSKIGSKVLKYYFSWNPVATLVFENFRIFSLTEFMDVYFSGIFFHMCKFMLYPNASRNMNSFEFRFRNFFLLERCCFFLLSLFLTAFQETSAMEECSFKRRLILWWDFSPLKSLLSEENNGYFFW